MKNRTRIPPLNNTVNIRFGGPLGDRPERVYLTMLLFEKLGLAPGVTVSLKIGQVSRQTEVSPVYTHSSMNEPLVFLSPDLYDQFQVAAGTAITLQFNYNEKVLSLGPLIGLFTVRNILPDATFGSQEPSLLALANSSENLGGLVFVFCPEDINWDRSLVTGYVPDIEHSPGHSSSQPATSGWLPIVVPLPDVVYDRLPSRTIEARPEVLEAKTRLTEQPNSLYFNPMFLDKWETHLILSKTGDPSEVAKYLPPTKLVEKPEDIHEFIMHYKSVFLKPSSGSLGRRIIKIHLDQAGHFNYFYRSRDKNTISGSTADFHVLINLLRPVMGKRTYIVQKDLALARYEDCPFDIRVLAQKDGRGNWRRTKIYVRKAAPDSFLSNLSDGAKPKAITEVLREVFNADFQAPYGLGEDIRRAVREIPPALEKGTGKIWGELGIDLGIDQLGRIWLIEINSKPFRALVSESGSIKIIRRSLMRPLEFAKYLAGFYRHSPVKTLAVYPPSNEI